MTVCESKKPVKAGSKAFRQKKLFANRLFAKTAFRQNGFSPKRLFAKTAFRQNGGFAKDPPAFRQSAFRQKSCFRQPAFRQSAFRQNGFSPKSFSPKKYYLKRKSFVYTLEGERYPNIGVRSTIVMEECIPAIIAFPGWIDFRVLSPWNDCVPWFDF